MADVRGEKHAEETSQMLTVPNCSGLGRARLLRKHLAEAAISKARLFSALDCCILISKPTLSILSLPCFSLPRLIWEVGGVSGIHCFTSTTGSLWATEPVSLRPDSRLKF